MTNRPPNQDHSHEFTAVLEQTPHWILRWLPALLFGVVVIAVLWAAHRPVENTVEGPFMALEVLTAPTPPTVRGAVALGAAELRAVAPGQRAEVQLPEGTSRSGWLTGQVTAVDLTLGRAYVSVADPAGEVAALLQRSGPGPAGRARVLVIQENLIQQALKTNAAR